ncbi:MAG: MotB family protein [Litorivicinus sp.]
MAAADEDHECPAGIPAWVMTFADLMSLLMCFFVLLLSFSEMDVQKFKQLMGSVQFAFGVQTEIEAKAIPKGTSIIAQEFSPGTPRPTVAQTIQQQTTSPNQSTLDIPPPTSDTTPKKSEQASAEDSAEGRESKAENDSETPTESTESNPLQALGADQGVADIDNLDPSAEQLERGGFREQLVLQTQRDKKAIEDTLSQEVRDGLVEVETQGRKIIVRVTEQNSFDPGRADIVPRFVPVLRKIRSVLAITPGLVKVEGHTDGRSSTGVYRTELELSAMRANAVAGELLAGGVLDVSRFSVVGVGSSLPRNTGLGPDALAANRRVEIIVDQGIGPGDIQGSNLDASNPEDNRIREDQDARLRSRFGLRSDEIF